MALHPCIECKAEISTDARICPHCGKKQGSGGCATGCLSIFVLLVFFLLIGTWATNKSANAPAPNTTQAPDGSELLIASCGAPSSDDSTALDNPRPPIPTRIVEYKAKKLRFLFIPDGAKLGEPPPYRWKLVGITDMTARDPSKAKTVSPEEAAVRMPCWTGD